MRILILLLSLIITLPSDALRFTGSVEESDFFSAQAIDELNALLRDTALTLSADGYDLTLSGDPALWARSDGVIASGKDAAPLEVPSDDADALTLARQIGKLLSEWETEREDAVDLQEAGTARTQLRYVLGEDGWARMWPRAAAILGLDAYAEATITGKATFKRYFDRHGQEFGAYFYAEKVHWGGKTREIRLEYAAQPEKGIYLAFRCPDGKGANTRVALHAKYNGGGWTVNAEASETAANSQLSCSLEGRTDGELTAEYAQKRNGKKTARALTLQLRGEEADYLLSDGQKTLAAGVIAWHKAALPERSAAADGTEEAVAAAFAHSLLNAIRQYAPESWQQILYMLSPQAWADIHKEDR